MANNKRIDHYKVYAGGAVWFNIVHRTLRTWANLEVYSIDVGY